MHKTRGESKNNLLKVVAGGHSPNVGTREEFLNWVLILLKVTLKLSNTETGDCSRSPPHKLTNTFPCWNGPQSLKSSSH